jgi:hypothetical protein
MREMTGSRNDDDIAAFAMRGSTMKGDHMRKFMTLAGAALLAASVAGAAYGQANPNAPQPNSAGNGIYVPGTSPTGQAIDRFEGPSGVVVVPDTTGTVGMARDRNGNARRRPVEPMPPDDGTMGR